MDRIIWTTDERGIMHGVVGEMDLFMIFVSDVPQPTQFPKFCLNSRLDFEVPDMRMNGDDLDAVKGMAERQVAAYIDAFGATFKTMEQTAMDKRRQGAIKTLHRHGVELRLGHGLSLEQIEALADVAATFPEED